MSTRLRLVLPRWGDNQLDAFDGMNFDFSALLNICFRCLANRGPNLSVDFDLTDGKRTNRLYDNALRADQRVDIGFFGAGLELFHENFACKDQKADGYNEENNHLQRDRRVEKRG